MWPVWVWQSSGISVMHKKKVSSLTLLGPERIFYGICSYRLCCICSTTTAGLCQDLHTLMALPELHGTDALGFAEGLGKETQGRKSQKLGNL